MGELEKGRTDEGFPGVVVLGSPCGPSSRFISINGSVAQTPSRKWHRKSGGELANRQCGVFGWSYMGCWPCFAPPCQEYL